MELSFHVMERQSFARWQLPPSLLGVLLFEDVEMRRLASQERHLHAELELHFVTRGTALFLLEDRRLPAEEGTLLFVPPGKHHLLLESSSDMKRWMLLCRRRLVRRVIPANRVQELLGPKARSFAGLLAGRPAATLRRTYDEVRGQLREEIPLANAGVAYALARSWQLFASASTGQVTTPFHDAIASALRSLRQEVPPPTLPKLAASTGLSEAHLSKLFSAEVGVTITEFRNRIRLERFLALYGEGSRLTALDAALEAGFGSYPQFHRVFKQQMGYSPGAHRR
jgi:AraC-like DNA-binding protein